MAFTRILFALQISIAMAYAAPQPRPKASPKSSPAATVSKPLAASEVRRAKWDTTTIHKLYLEADFDEAIDKCETGLAYVTPLAHDDSVFIFKHLGVMYTSKYETREKGKINMMRLLEVEPTARIMDMYASDMIYMIFKNIKDEFDMSQAKMARANKMMIGGHPKSELDQTDDSDLKPAKTKTGSGNAWVGWTAGALAAAGGVALYLHMSDEEAKPVKQGNVVP